MSNLIDRTAWSSFWKDVFRPGVLENLALHPHVLVKSMKREGEFVGDLHVEPIQIMSGVGASSNFATAQVNSRGAFQKKWIVRRKKLYRFVKLDAETMAASKDKVGAYLHSKKEEFKGAIEDIGEKLARDVVGDGSGALARVASIDVPNNRIYLTEQADVDKFWYQMFLVAAAAKTTGNLRTGVVQVVGKNNDEGYIQVDSTANITGLAANDYLFIQGDRLNEVDGGPLVVTGLQAYIPLIAPTAADPDLNGITGADRARYMEELAGWRLQTFPGSIMSAVDQLHTKMKRRKRTARTIWLSYENYRRAERELGDKVMRSEGVSAKYGVPSFSYISGGTKCEFMCDPFLPEDRGYSLDMSTWKIKHLEGLPHLIDEDGLTMLRSANSDDFEVRWRAWLEVLCNAPIENGVFAINYN